MSEWKFSLQVEQAKQQRTRSFLPGDEMSSESKAGEAGLRCEESSPTMSSAAASRRTIKCLLCGGTHVYPSPRFENHLLNEHGIVFDVDFFVRVSVFRQREGRLPKLEDQMEREAAGKQNKGGGQSYLIQFGTWYVS